MVGKAARDHRRARPRARRRSAQMELAEARAFLQWLADDHFTFLGYRCHDLVVKDGEDALRLVPGSGLGILREPGGRGARDQLLAAAAGGARAMRARAGLLIVTKANTRSTVHRPGYLDYVGVKRYDDAARCAASTASSASSPRTAYSARPAEIPLLRGKVAQCPIERAGSRPAGTRGKALDAHPRDLPARRAVPDRGRRAVRDRARHPAARRAPAPAPVRAARPVRALRLVPDLRAARELQDRPARASSRRS